jgi:hypothetical protein
VLYLHPALRERSEAVVLAAVYMIPVINYGDVVSDELCVRYGATLLGMEEAEYYRQVCAMADQLGAEARFDSREAPAVPRPNGVAGAT